MSCSPMVVEKYLDSRVYISTLVGEGIMEKIMNVILEEVVQKPYTPPVIIHELELETRAGSLLGLPDPFDLGDE